VERTILIVRVFDSVAALLPIEFILIKPGRLDVPA
jgi:hypothetical protein